MSNIGAHGFTKRSEGASRNELFSAGSNASVVLTGIAEVLFSELRVYASLWSTERLNGDALDVFPAEYFNRAERIVFLLEMLEHACGLKFAAGSRVAFLYHRGDWPDGAPLIGYSGISPQILPSQVATAFINNLGSRIHGGFQMQLLRGALWHLSRSDLQTTITLLFDLVESGFGDPLYHGLVATYLLRAHAAADGTAGLIKQLREGAQGRTVRKVVKGPDGLVLEPAMRLSNDDDIDWRRIELPYPSDHFPGYDGQGQHDILAALFTRVNDRISMTRSAADLDEWLTGMAVLQPLMSSVHCMLTGLIDPLPLALRARLSQWDEIQADIFAMFAPVHEPLSTWAAGQGMFWNGLRDHARFVVAMVSHAAGEHSPDRVYRERLVIPARLREEFLTEGNPYPPVGWAAPSWRIIHPTSPSPGVAGPLRRLLVTTHAT